MTGLPPGPPPRSEPAPGWNQSLSTGAPGIALAHIAAARAGDGDWKTVHGWAAAMTRASVLAAPDACGLFHGAPAVAFALHAAGHPAYAEALDILDAHIAAVTRTRLRAAHARIDVEQLPRLREFDLISGLTGLGAYLLHRHGEGELLEEVLAYLVRLVRPIRTDSGEVLPGWWSSDGPDGRPCSEGGHGNLGIAHGVSGPLALLATAMRHGIIVSGQAEAVAQISAWLDDLRRGTPEAPWWPETISRAERRTGALRQPGPGRPSWCYGTPGLARAQQLAALALEDEARRRRAEEALAVCIGDPGQLDSVTDASLCHGWAGLLHTVRAVAAEAPPDSPLARRLPTLRRQFEEFIRQHGMPDDNGLLEGRAGVHLAINPCSSVGWDACLLLAG